MAGNIQKAMSPVLTYDDQAIKKRKNSFDLQELNHNIGHNDSSIDLHRTLGIKGQDSIKFTLEMLFAQIKNHFPGSDFDADKVADSLRQLVLLANTHEMTTTQQKGLHLQKANFSTAAIQLQGKDVQHSGNRFDLQDDEQEIYFHFSEHPHTTKISFYNDEGNLIFIKEIDAKKGRNKFIWDGKMSDGDDAPKGEHTIAIEAYGIYNNPLDAEIELKSRITDIDFSNKEFVVPYSGSVPIYNLDRMTYMDKAMRLYQTQTMQPPVPIPTSTEMLS